MKLQNAASVLAILSTASHVAGFTTPSQFASYGASALTQSVVSPELQFIRADVAVAGQKKKKKSKKKKNKEPIASPYTVAQGTSKKTKQQVKENSESMPTVLASTEQAAAEPAIETVAINGEAINGVEVETDIESGIERLAREAMEREIAAASRLRQESISRSLLEARVARETIEREQAALQAKLEQEAASKLRQEIISKSLLEARLARETSERELELKLEVEAALKLRQETISRSLLEARLTRETNERNRAVALAAKRRTEAAALGLMQYRFVQEAAERLAERKRKQVATNRALFEARLVLEANSKAYKAKLQQELNQRAILVDRLEREEQVREAVRFRKERLAARKSAILEARSQPKAPDVERALQDTYAAIEDLGERAFAMLVDLGLVEPSPDPPAPDYDDFYDDEFVYDFAY